MSDDDNDFMQDSDEEQYAAQLLTLSVKLLMLSRYDFEYEDDEDEDTGDVGIENKYYNAKQMKAENPGEAIVEFLGLPAMEEEKGDW